MVRPDSAGRLDFTASLPTELLLYLLSKFSFDELLPLLAVNRRWRAVALDSEPYWSFVKLDALTAGGVNLFVTRLSRAEERPVALNVNIKLDNQGSSALQATVLSALREHLHQIDWITLYLRGPDAPALWRSFEVAASKLRYLSIRSDLIPASDALPVVPANLFAGEAPRLRSVTLVDIDLPAQSLSVFSNVAKFTLLYGTVRVVPDIFRHFPALDTIDMPNDASFAHPAFHTGLSYGNIKDCVWRSGRGAHNFPLPLAATRGVEIVTIYFPRPEEIRGIIEHLQAPLEMSYMPGIEYPEDEFELCVSQLDALTERCRVIVDETVFWADRDSELRRALAGALDGKLHTLRVHATQWDTVSRCMPAFPGLQRVRINIEREGDVAALSRAAFPSRNVRVFELAAPHCVWVPERAVADFVEASFGPLAPGEATLLLVNVHLRGSPRRFGEFFKETRTAHIKPCQFPHGRPQPHSLLIP